MANEYREMKEDELKKENRQVEKREGGYKKMDIPKILI